MEDIKKLKKIIIDHEVRISKLENQINSKTVKSKSEKTKKDKSHYSGIVGGIQLLIDNGFLNNPKSSKEIHREMNKKRYFKSLQSVDGSVRKKFVKKKILERIKDDKIWKYVIRK